MVILQPTSFCNLNCKYCYVPHRRDTTVMGDQVLEATIRHIFNSNLITANRSKDPLIIVCHAGEPLVVGKAFYQKALDIIKKYDTGTLPYTFEIQTNAVLINQDWVDFFMQNNIKVSVSIDGPESIHNKNRRTWNDKGSFAKVMKGIETLKRNNIPLRGIAVITKDSLAQPDAMYSFFKDNDFQSICFNIDELNGDNANTSYSVPETNYLDPGIKQQFESFFARLFELWLGDNQQLNIREFSTILQIIFMKKTNALEIFANDSAIAFASLTIATNGNITTFSPELASGLPGDLDAFTIGNVLDINSFDDLRHSPIFEKQLTAIGTGIKNCAATCEYFDFCGGGSPANKMYETGSFETTETIACQLRQQVLHDLVVNKLIAYSKQHESSVMSLADA